MKKEYAGGAFFLVLAGILTADSSNMIPSILLFTIGLSIMGAVVCAPRKC